MLLMRCVLAEKLAYLSPSVRLKVNDAQSALVKLRTPDMVKED